MPLPVSLADADAVVLAAARLFDGPGADARPVGSVARDTTLKLAARGADCIPAADELCAERWMIAGTHAWVSAADIAVRDNHPLSPVDLRGHWLTEKPASTDHSQVPDTAWLGVATRWEWSPEGGRDRILAYGQLFIEIGGALRRVDMGNASGWGSAETLDARRWLDLDGDGAAELIVVLDTTITEAGSGGRVVRVFDATLTLRHEQWVGDPRLTGLDQAEWGAVHLVGPRLVHDSLVANPCRPAHPRPPVADPGSAGAVLCPAWGRTSWPAGAPAASAPTADGLPILAWYLPESTHATERNPVTVLIADGDTARWVYSPKVEPAWVGHAFANDPDGSDWVVLYP